MAETDPQTPRMLITAGPTHEPIDAVRYLANRSSGRMGLALAEAAMGRGWPTTLLLGPTHLQPPQSTLLALDRFRTTADLQRLLTLHWHAHDVLIMAAAVSDYRPTHTDPTGKLPRTDDPLTIEFEPTPDLLAELAPTTRGDQTVIGFALEPPDRLADSARRKMLRKRLDAIVANPLQTMDSETVTARLFLRHGEVLTCPPKLTKPDFAAWLMGQIEAMRRPRPGR